MDNIAIVNVGIIETTKAYFLSKEDRKINIIEKAFDYITGLELYEL